jgi:hypothetical protein
MEGVSATATQPAAGYDGCARTLCKFIATHGACIKAECPFMHPLGTHQPRNDGGNNGPPGQQG